MSEARSGASGRAGPPAADPAPVLVALDTTDLGTAASLARAIAPHVAGIKLGLEFFGAHGPEGVRRVAAGLPLFLDLKFHDIPNTVAGAVRAVLPLQPRYLTVHAAGGPAMLAGAVAAAAEAPIRPRVLAVTVLTSLADPDLAAVGQAGPSALQVERLALLAQDRGVDGVVCSPQDVAALRIRCGPEFLLVVPGIRPADGPVIAGDDQKRAATPQAAWAAGASLLVIGRPITAAADPVAAAAAIAARWNR